jgi:hypothetical protein
MMRPIVVTPLLAIFVWFWTIVMVGLAHVLIGDPIEITVRAVAVQVQSIFDLGGLLLAGWLYAWLKKKEEAQKN